MDQNTTAANHNDHYVISYLTLRKAVGILGLALPVLLLGFFAWMNPGQKFPPSISHYYYTNMGPYFTGTLCAIALFMFAYNGPQVQDRRAAILVCVCALGIVFLPTNTHLRISADVCPRVFLAANTLRNNLHYGLAALLFLTLAYFCLVLFTKTGEAHPTKQKLLRNRIYKICGWVIIATVVAIILLSIKPIARFYFARRMNASIFILETIALVAFGFSWLVKGETFLKDQPSA